MPGGVECSIHSPFFVSLNNHNAQYPHTTQINELLNLVLISTEGIQEGTQSSDLKGGVHLVKTNFFFFRYCEHSNLSIIHRAIFRIVLL